MKGDESAVASLAKLVEYTPSPCSDSVASPQHLTSVVRVSIFGLEPPESTSREVGRQHIFAPQFTTQVAREAQRNRELPPHLSIGYRDSGPAIRGGDVAPKEAVSVPFLSVRYDGFGSSVREPDFPVHPRSGLVPFLSWRSSDPLAGS